jgi:hypothetical protein
LRGAAISLVLALWALAGQPTTVMRTRICAWPGRETTSWRNLTRWHLRSRRSPGGGAAKTNKRHSLAPAVDGAVAELAAVLVLPLGPELSHCLSDVDRLACVDFGARRRQL